MDMQAQYISDKMKLKEAQQCRALWDEAMSCDDTPTYQ